jgi:hypothetical protein
MAIDDDIAAMYVSWRAITGMVQQRAREVRR